MPRRAVVRAEGRDRRVAADVAPRPLVVAFVTGLADPFVARLADDTLGAGLAALGLAVDLDDAGDAGLVDSAEAPPRRAAVRVLEEEV